MILTVMQYPFPPSHGGRQDLFNLNDESPINYEETLFNIKDLQDSDSDSTIDEDVEIVACCKRVVPHSVVRR